MRPMPRCSISSGIRRLSPVQPCRRSRAARHHEGGRAHLPADLHRHVRQDRLRRAAQETEQGSTNLGRRAVGQKRLAPRQLLSASSPPVSDRKGQIDRRLITIREAKPTTLQAPTVRAVLRRSVPRAEGNRSRGRGKEPPLSERVPLLRTKDATSRQKRVIRGKRHKQPAAAGSKSQPGDFRGDVLSR